MTNLERIKNMNTDEIAEFWDDTVDCVDCPHGNCCDAKDCKGSIKDWFNSESDTCLKL